jgi:hypothetical protein
MFSIQYFNIFRGKEDMKNDNSFVTFEVLAAVVMKATYLLGYNVV